MEQATKINYGYRPTISKEEAAALPTGSFDKEISVVDTEEKLAEAVQYLKQCTVLGFDTETKPAFKKGQSHKVALLQLSDANRAFLIKLNAIGLSDELKDILASPKIVKAGVAVTDDIKGLRKLNDFEPGGFVELQRFAKKYGIEDMSLLKLSAITLGFRISKAQRLSNWEATELSEAQKKYAATDAWVGHQIYTTLKASKAQ